MAKRNASGARSPRVDWFECEDCGFMFSTRAGARADIEGADDCPRCEQGVGRVVLEDVPLI